MGENSQKEYGGSLEFVDLENGVFYCAYDGDLFLVRLMDLRRIENRLKKLLSLVPSLKSLADVEVVEDQELRSEARRESSKCNGNRRGSGRKAEAMMVADSIRGMSVAEIMKKRYPHSKHSTKKYSKGSVYRALSLKNEADAERFAKLYEDFPEVFSGISVEEVMEWCKRRAKI